MKKLQYPFHLRPNDTIVFEWWQFTALPTDPVRMFLNDWQLRTFLQAKGERW